MKAINLYLWFGWVLGISVALLTPVSSQELPETINKLKPSIVAVGTYMPTRSPRVVFRGTGFVVDDGSLIVTNAHVLPEKLNHQKLEKLAVFFRKDKQSKMAIVKKLVIDTQHDIAVLQLTKGRLPALILGSSEQVREGQLVAFTGFPIGMILGLYPVTHRGIVSAITPMAIPMLKARQLNAKLMKRLREPYDVFQLDATAYPGNSGSPLYGAKDGKVIGVINKVFIKESKEAILSNPSGITYAIPIHYVKKLLLEKAWK
jgi:S1-C subfamily serine protease